jgi:hypothetical protein
VDEEIATVFSAAFADVQSHFGNLFITLFPGGSGRIFLIDPNDPLNRRISLMVLKQPPNSALAPTLATAPATPEAAASPSLKPASAPTTPLPAPPAADQGRSSAEMSASERPYSAGLQQQAGSAEAPKDGSARFFPPRPDGGARETQPRPPLPVPDAASNRGQAFVLPGAR